MKDKNMILKEYMEENLKLKACVEKLNQLRKEKEEILTLATSENPPENILSLIKKNLENYNKLLKISNKLKEEIQQFSNTTK